MSYLWGELLDILKKHLHYHQEILHLALEKKETLIMNQVDALLLILEKEEKILQRVEGLEAKREEILSDLGFKEGVSLKEILIKAPVVMKGHLEELQEELHLTLKKLQRENASNATLINEALDLNEFSIQLFSVGNEARAYRPNEGKNKEVSYRLFDEKA